MLIVVGLNIEFVTRKQHTNVFKGLSGEFEYVPQFIIVLKFMDFPLFLICAASMSELTLHSQSHLQVSLRQLKDWRKQS